MDKKAVTLQQVEEALRDLSRWIKDKLTGYMAEPAAEGKSGYVLTTNGAGGRSWEYIPGATKPDKTLSQDGEAADAAAVGEALQQVEETARAAGEAAREAGEAAQEAQKTAESITTETIGAEKEKIKVLNAELDESAYAADNTYEDFPFRANIPLPNAEAEMVPEVVFSAADALSGVFSPTAETYDGGVSIYASETKGTTIPTIILWR